MAVKIYITWKNLYDIYIVPRGNAGEEFSNLKPWKPLWVGIVYTCVFLRAPTISTRPNNTKPKNDQNSVFDSPEDQIKAALRSVECSCRNLMLIWVEGEEGGFGCKKWLIRWLYIKMAMFRV